MNDIPPETAAAPSLSLVAIANLLLRRRRILLAVASTLALVNAVGLLVIPRSYSVSSSFIIRSNNIGGAAGLAAQLGVDVGGIDVSQSPQFYATLVKTPDVLVRLADTAFSTSQDAKPRALADIWRLTQREPRLKRAAVIERLQKVISSSVGLKMDVVTVSVITEDPLLSRELAEAVLEQVNRFNLQTLQSRASAERKFSEARMAEVQAELRVAEDATQRFYEVNRQPGLSAALEIEKQRLYRKVDLLTTTYALLATAFERARMDEVRDTPLITIIERPALPVRADPRGIVTRTLLVFFLGLTGGSVLILVLESIRWMRSSADEESREFNRLVAETAQDISRVHAMLMRFTRRLRTEK